jgi:predicted transcriptional regulator YheO
MDNGPAPDPGRTVLMELAAAIGAALGPEAEVVLHDLAALPNTIVAVHGDVTGRKVGDPATNTLLRILASGAGLHDLGYTNTLPDGRRVRSSTLVFATTQGPTHALCVNVDLSGWDTVERVARAATGGTAVAEQPEAFVSTVGELQDVLLREAITGVGVPVALMRKEQKVAVVRRLHAGGLFMLRSGVEVAAEALGVSRFSIYNYLREEVVAGDRVD